MDDAAAGAGKLGLVTGGQRKEKDVSVGDVFVVPRGRVFYFVNIDSVRRLHLFAVSEPLRRPELAVYEAFDMEILAQAFNKAAAAVGPTSATLYNIEKESKHDVNAKKFAALSAVGLGAFKVSLRPGALLAPHYNPDAMEVALVTRGRGWVQIAVPGSTSVSRSLLEPGAVFVVPQFYAIAQLACEDDPLEFVGFHKTAQEVEPVFLADPGGSVNQIPGECTINGDIRQGPEILLSDQIPSSLPVVSLFPSSPADHKVKGYVAEINKDPGQLATRGPCSKYTLPDEGLQAKLEIEFEEMRMSGVACDLNSPGFHALCAATERVIGHVKPYSITGSLPLIRDLQPYSIVCSIVNGWVCVHMQATPLSGLRPGKCARDRFSMAEPAPLHAAVWLKKQVTGIVKAAAAVGPTSATLYNIERESKHDVEGEGGWSTQVNSKKFAALSAAGLGAFKARLRPGALLAPHYNPDATEVAFVTHGRGWVQIAGPGGTSVTHALLEPGSIFVVPQFYAVAQLASKEDPFEFAGFHTTAQEVEPVFLAGMNSVLKTVGSDVLSASTTVRREKLDDLLGAQDESVIISANVTNATDPLSPPTKCSPPILDLTQAY
eukprot:jgi/Mesen1/8204/ME000442S07481